MQTNIDIQSQEPKKTQEICEEKEYKPKSFSSKHIPRKNFKQKADSLKNPPNPPKDSDECLGYASVYTSDQKDDKDSNETEKTRSTGEAENERAEKKSTFPCSPYNFYLNDNFFSNRRKSSDICNYFNSSHKFLTEMLEKNSNLSKDDYTKTNNYIKKDSFCNPYSFNNKYDNENYKASSPTTYFTGLSGENFSQELNKIRTSSFNDANDFTNPLGKISPLQMHQMNPKMINNYQMFCPKGIPGQGNPNVISGVPPQGNNAMGGKGYKHRPFVERAGDWVCSKCKNLNFAFRVICNRCKIPKSESEKNGTIPKINQSSEIVHSKTGKDFDSQKEQSSSSPSNSTSYSKQIDSKPNKSISKITNE